MCRTDRDPAKVTSSTKYPPFRGPIMPQPSLSSRRSWSAGQSFYAGSWIPQVTLAIFFALMRSDGGDIQQQLRPRSEATPCTNLLNPTAGSEIETLISDAHRPWNWLSFSVLRFLTLPCCAFNSKLFNRVAKKAQECRSKNQLPTISCGD